MVVYNIVVYFTIPMDYYDLNYEIRKQIVAVSKLWAALTINNKVLCGSAEI